MTVDSLGSLRVFVDATDEAGTVWSAMAQYSIDGRPLPQDTCFAGQPLRVARRWGALAEAGGKLFMVGGLRDVPRPQPNPALPTALASVEQCNGPGLAWDSAAPLCLPRFDHCVVALGDTLYAIGGRGNGRDHNTVERRDPVSGTWSLMADTMPAVRFGMAACAVGGSIYVVGGMVDNGIDFVLSNTIDKYTPSTGNWETVATMSVRRAYHQAVVRGGQIVIAGGEGGASDRFELAAALQSTEMFTIATNGVAAGTALSIPRLRSSAVAVGDSVYLFGGTSSRFDYNAQSTSSVVSLLPSVLGWRTEDALPTPLHSASACVSGTAIVVAGGVNNSGSSETGNVWVYYP
jgi:N-acetylneuraminic acid mutarotase